MSDIVVIETTPVEPSESYKGRVYIPLAPLSAVTLLADEGYKIKLIDQRIDPLWKEHLLAEIKQGPLCVGISSLTGRQILAGIEAARTVKENSNIPVVWGGIHASLLPEQTLEHPDVDVVVQGEGEETFRELVRALERGRTTFDGIKGVFYKTAVSKDAKGSRGSGGGIRGNERRPFLKMDTLPRIPFDLVDLADYTEMFPIPTSRGCGYRCEFCYNVAYQCKKWRAKKPENVIEDIKFYTRKYDRKSVVFREDNFFQNLARVRTICRSMIEENLNLRWTSTCRVNIAARMTEEDIDLLLESGFWRFAIGIESGSQRILDAMKKDITLEDVRFVADRMARRGIPIIASFVAGHPEETEDDLRQTIDLITYLFDKDPRLRFSIDLLTPYPGTALYDRAVKKGFTFPTRLEEWAGYERLKSQFGANLEERHAVFRAEDHWLPEHHRRKILAANRLGQVAGEGLRLAPRTKNKAAATASKLLPTSLLVRWARHRWRNGMFGPTPELPLFSWSKSVEDSVWRTLKRTSGRLRPFVR